MLTWFKCPFDAALLEIWQTPALVEDENTARARVEESTASIALEARFLYEQALDAGSYLVCVRPSCAAVWVEQDAITTVNIRRLMGPTHFVVFDPGASAGRDAVGFEVGY